MGHWPPVFHAALGTWLLLAPVSRASVLFFCAALAAALAFFVFAVLRRDTPVWLAFAAAALTLSLPVSQTVNRSVMLESLTALCGLACAWFWARYLDTEDWRYSAAFGVAASLALLTKASGVALAPLPVVSVIALRRWRLPLRLSFWLPAAIVLATSGPWYLLVPGARHERVVPYGGLHFPQGPSLQRLQGRFVETFGFAVLALAVIGLFARAARRRDSRCTSRECRRSRSTDIATRRGAGWAWGRNGGYGRGPGIRARLRSVDRRIAARLRPDRTL